MAFTGVFPVYNLKFKIGTEGKASVILTDLATIADMETFSLSVDGNVENWTPFESEGWQRALMTGKGMTIGLNGKRNIGDAGNDYVASTAWKSGLDCSTIGQVEFPDGSKLDFNCVINVTNLLGGDSTNVAPLEFELIVDGKPNYTPAV